MRSLCLLAMTAIDSAGTPLAIISDICLVTKWRSVSSDMYLFISTSAFWCENCGVSSLDRFSSVFSSRS